jgi:HK97 family phage portal protein
MNIKNIFKRARVENPSTPLSASNIATVLGLSSKTAVGKTVNHDGALGLTAFWAGVRVISQTIAGLPLKAYLHTSSGREPATGHSIYKVLHERPNPYMSPFIFKEIRIAHCLTWGNSYAEIEYNNAGQVIGLWPLLPDRTGAELVDGKKKYWTYVSGTKIWLDADRVLHVPGLGFDGLRGYNVVQLHRESLGLSIAANEYGATFFGNSGKPSGVLTHPGAPTKDVRDTIREEWNQLHSGLTNAQRTAVLWGGMDWKPITIPPEEAQFLTTREMQIEEVARILNINPILLQQTSKQTSWGSGVAQFLTAFAKFTITPWLEREEDIINYDLFSETERGKYYVKYSVEQLMRGDPLAQAQILEIERRNGITNADEWRQLKELNPLPGEIGKAYYVPLNWIDITKEPDNIPKEPDNIPKKPDEDTDEEEQKSTVRSKKQVRLRSAVLRNKTRDSYIKVFEDAAARFVKRDTEGLAKAVKRAFEEADPVAVLERWIEEFYPDQERYIYRTMLPAVMSLSSIIAAEAADEVGTSAPEVDDFAEKYTENLARREAERSKAQVKGLIESETPETLSEALSTRAAEWSETRSGKVANNEVVRASSGVAKHVWAAVGISYLVWRANPGACPLCEELDGQRVGIKDYFLKKGESVSGGASTLVTDGDIGGPPLHQGCTCSIVPD